jgi:anti-sigma factor RsiW
MSSRDPAPLTCQELVELVTAYLEGSLPARERDRFDQHIAGCDGCTHYLQQMRLTIAALGHLPATAMAPPARDGLLAAFRTWKTTR